MKRLFIALLFAFIATGAVNAAEIIAGEVPVASADMDIIEAHLAFEQVKFVNLTMINDTTGKTKGSLIITYLTGDEGGTRVVEKVPVVEINDLECGSIQFVAQLQGSNDGLMKRFSIVLTDHRTRVCENFLPNVWEAEVREGFGFCGTMDATMSIAGNPEPIDALPVR